MGWYCEFNDKKLGTYIEITNEDDFDIHQSVLRQNAKETLQELKK